MSRYGLRTRPNARIPILAGGGLGITFRPNDLVDLRLWLDASDAATITHSSGAVSAWTSKDPNSRAFNKAGTTLTTGSTTLNGLNTLVFSAAYLTTTAANSVWNFLHDGTRYAAWAVCQFTSAGAFYGLLGTNGTTSVAHGASIYHDSSARIIHQVGWNQSGAWTALNDAGNNSFATATFALLEVISDPDNATAADRSEIRRNNGTALKNNTATNAPSTEDATRALQIGAAGNNAGPLAGGIAELVIAVDPSAGELGAMRTYMGDRWGLTLA